MERNDLKDEYIDVSENARHWGNIRFHQLTVFMAVMAGFLAVLFQINGALSELARLLLKVGGILTVVVFWVMDERVVQYWKHCLNRAVQLEKELGFRQYLEAPPRGLITAGNAVRLFFLALFSFWVITIIWYQLF